MSLENMSALYHEVRECRDCDLWQSRNLAVPGAGPDDALVMFVGEAPGEKENQAGLPFQGNAGRVFDNLLDIAGLSRDEIYVTGAVKCRPPDNRNPKAEEIHACNHYLSRQFEIIRPRVIVTLGRFGLMAATGSTEPIAKLRGHPFLHKGATVLATYHPASVFYRQELKQQMEDDFRQIGEIVQKIRRSYQH